MILSNSHFDPNLPYWQDYLPFLERLAGHSFPCCSQLNALLPPGLRSDGDQLIRFVASEQLEDAGYEQRIYTTGQVSTRRDSWHDLFNALVWIRYPHIKTAMNSLHYQAGADLKSGSRGQLRDALTLFDECGVIVFSAQLKLLSALAERNWSDAFLAGDFRRSVELSVCGHAILEKYLSPYKAMTAKALLVHVSPAFTELPRQEVLGHLDREIARLMRHGRVLTKPACLSPLPLAGVPGWWPQHEQVDQQFYNDQQVFRPAAAELTAAPVLRVYGVSNGTNKTRASVPGQQ